MSLSQPIALFGVHSLTAYNLETHQPLGIAKVIGEAGISSEGELIPLNGGSSKHAFKVERGKIKTQLSLKVSEYPSFLFETLMGKALTANAAETSGSVTTLTNQGGTSLKSATTGVASVSVTSKGSVKFGKYLVKAVTATTVDVYGFTDLDFAQGEDKVFENDALKITATPLTIVANTATAVPGFGVSLTGGSGTIGMTAGDTAYFSARPINTGSREVVIGSTNEVFQDFGLILTGQRQGDNFMSILDCYRCAGIGLPIGMKMSEFAEATITIDLYYDSARNGVFSMQDLKATT